MDWQTLINVGGTIGLTVLGWYLNAQKSAAESSETKREALKQELTNFRIEVARDYVTTHDLADIKTTLVRIETKLDAKADK
jgi:ribosomal protein L29